MARILFVEDDALVRHGLSRVLVAGGHDVLACGTQADALARATAFDADLALLDIGLPDGDGVACAQALRAAGFGGPVVYLTAEHEQQAVARALAVGAQAYLVKPIVGAQLLPAVQAALGSAEAAGAQQRRMEQALRNSREISAAVGVLAQQQGLTLEQAFEHLRREARSRQQPLRERAQAVIDGLPRGPGTGLP